MLDTLFIFSFEFWCVIGLLVFGFFWCKKKIKNGIGLPAAAVLFTVFIWYVGDALYNDYLNTHMKMFPPLVLSTAWWQVVVFLLVFICSNPFLHKFINKRYLKSVSHAYIYYKKGIKNEQFQRGLKVLFRAGMIVWIILLFGAIFRFKADFVFYLFPYLGRHPGPWVTTGLGGGIDTFLALANYLQLMVGALFGVVAALSTNTRIRRLAIIGVLLIWPYYIFDRTRKFILVVVVPGLCAWAYLRLRGGVLKKSAVLIIFFLAVNSWFGFIISNRTSTTVTKAFFESGFDFSTSSREEHQGLNMYEELAWITMLTSSDIFTPEWGGNYFANLVNPIPRFFWPSKPTIGLDYAIARGLSDASNPTGVCATLSNGLIGQGIVNFGLYLGPAFAAFLMSLWAVWLARIDLQGNKIGYLPLYTLGLVLTFTMGRDITFLELYPFVFGYCICWWLNRKSSLKSMSNKYQKKLAAGVASSRVLSTPASSRFRHSRRCDLG